MPFVELSQWSREFVVNFLLADSLGDLGSSIMLMHELVPDTMIASITDLLVDLCLLEVILRSFPI